MQKAEEKRQQEMERRKAAHVRAQMQRYSRQAMERKQKEAEAQLAEDMAILQRVMEEGKEEEFNLQEKKVLVVDIKLLTWATPGTTRP